MKGFMDMMQQAQELQSKMQDMQAQLEALQIEGEAGAGLVRVMLNGHGKMTGLTVDDSLMKPGEKEILEDLVVAAHADAKSKLEQAAAEKMQDLTGGLPIPPGMKLF